jgi:hypothetical protein
MEKGSKNETYTEKELEKLFSRDLFPKINFIEILLYKIQRGIIVSKAEKERRKAMKKEQEEVARLILNILEKFK